MDRRDFLKAIALTGVAMIIKPGGTMDLLAQSVTDPATGGKTDLIAVMIHWGIEYQTTQNEYQTQVADFLIANGADLILGSHSHVPQPMETRTVTLDDGSTRSAFVAYSLGNFVSNLH